MSLTVKKPVLVRTMVPLMIPQRVPDVREVEVPLYDTRCAALGKYHKSKQRERSNKMKQRFFHRLNVFQVVGNHFLRRLLGT